MKTKIKILAGLALPILGMTASHSAEDVFKPEIRSVGGPVTPYHYSGDLRNAPTVEGWKIGDPIKEVPRRHSTAKDPQSGDYQMTRDPLAELQKQSATRNHRAFGDQIVNMDGMGFSGVNPPDPVGDIGKNYFIQSINNASTGSIFTIHDKTDGSVVAGPIAMETLAPSGACTGGDGDPIILYDEVAERWFMQEFVSGGANTLCFYISATDDPVSGGWNFYQFVGATFPDYPHFGVWPDAYLGTANEDEATVYVFDRANMITGGVARAPQVVVLGDLPGYGFQTATPVDWDGVTPPPAGTAGLFMRHIDEEAHGTFTNNTETDLLEMYEFVVDFDDDNNSSFNQLADITITDFNSWFNGYFVFDSVPQPGSTAKLDPIREVILNRLQYRNFGGFEVIVGLIPTNINPATTGDVVNAGLRWFELRRVGGLAGSWTLHQEGTFDPGESTENRLVGALSMDSAGNIAMAYSITDTDAANPISPSIAYTGRLANDPNDVMTQTEVFTQIGNGANTSGRWGDYASMGVDPVDGCTFWFTGEYQTGASWSTHISSFKFDACGDPGYALSADETSQQLCVIAGAANFTSNINLASISDYTDDVNLAFNPALPAGFTGVFAANPVAAGDSTTVNFTVADTVPSGDYTLTLEADSAAAANPTQTLDYLVSVVDTMPAGSTLLTPTDAETGVMAQPNFTWSADADANSYLIEVATDDQFNNIVISEVVFTNSFTPGSDLATSTDHYWRVTSQNVCGDVVSAVFMFTTNVAPGDCPIGAVQTDIYSYVFDDIVDPPADLIFRDGFENEVAAVPWEIQTDIGAENWSLEPVGDGGSLAYQADNLTTVSDSTLISPVMTLPVGVGPLTLRFWNTQTIEDQGGTACYDAAQLLISVDGGPFVQVSDADIINNQYDGVINTGFSSPAGGELGWCGDPMAATVFNINADTNAGSDVQYGFRITSDESFGRPEGWAIDNVRITGCEAP